MSGKKGNLVFPANGQADIGTLSLKPSGPGALVPEGSLTPGVFVADGDAEGSAEASG